MDKRVRKSLRVIGFAGQKFQGKDLIADYVAPRLRSDGVTWKRESFANAVKDIYCQSFHVDRDFVEKWKPENEAPPGFLLPVRKSLTFIGDGFRKIKETIWIDKVFEKNPNYIVLSDSRYINELKKIKEEDGINILLYRDGKLNNDENASEAQLKPYIEWCIASNSEGLVREFPAYQQYQKNLSVADKEFFQNLSLIDFFIKNNGSVDDFYKKFETIVLPYLMDNYEIDYAGT